MFFKMNSKETNIIAIINEILKYIEINRFKYKLSDFILKRLYKDRKIMINNKK